VISDVSKFRWPGGSAFYEQLGTIRSVSAARSQTWPACQPGMKGRMQEALGYLRTRPRQPHKGPAILVGEAGGRQKHREFLIHQGERRRREPLLAQAPNSVRRCGVRDGSGARPRQLGSAEAPRLGKKRMKVLALIDESIRPATRGTFHGPRRSHTRRRVRQSRHSRGGGRTRALELVGELRGGLTRRLNRGKTIRDASRIAISTAAAAAARRSRGTGRAWATEARTSRVPRSAACGPEHCPSRYGGACRDSSRRRRRGPGPTADRPRCARPSCSNSGRRRGPTPPFFVALGTAGRGSVFPRNYVPGVTLCSGNRQ